MATLLPSPDVVLSEKLVLCETRLSDDILAERSSALRQESVCDVLQLAARKAVGCAVGDGVVEAEPSVVLSPDCKHLAVKEPCSRRICLLSAQDGFKEVIATLEPLPVSRDGDVVADTVLSCSWSADSKLLLVACKSSAVYLFDSTGRLLCHWDPTWSWGQLQLVAACHGPGNTILILTAARVLFLVAHNGDKQQRGSSAGAEALGSDDGNFMQQQLQFQQQQVLEKYSVKRYHTAVSAIGYDDKSGLLVIAGDSGSISSSPSSHASSSTGSSSGANSPAAAPSAAFAEEGVTVSVWQLQDRQLNLRFALGKPQGGPGMLASTVASAMGVDRASLSAAAATRWSVVFSPLLEYVALLTGNGSIYLLSLTENCLVDPASGFAGRSAGSHTSSATSSSSIGSSATNLSPRERGSTGLKPKHIPLTPYVTDASGSLVCSSCCNRSVAWWGPRVLAVAAADGSVSLVRLPESVNILGAAPIRFAAGSRVVANYSGSRGLLIVEPISAAAAAAVAGTTAAGAAAAAVASGLQLTATEATFAADASAAVGLSAVLAARRNLAAAATASDIQRLGRAGETSDGGGSADGAGSSSRASAWVARKLGVSRDELTAAATAAGGSSGVAGWRLVLLAERTPQQMVQVHLRLRDWGSALNISKAYGLDTDAVYLARWSDAPVSRSGIQDNLPKIKSKRARVAECLTRVAPDYESARLLISYGLRETAAHAEPPEKVAAAAAGHAAAAAAAGSAFVTPVKGSRPAGAAGGAPSTPGGLTGPAGPMSPLGPGVGIEAPRLDSFPAAKAAEVRWWRLQRLKLLALNDRLETCMALKRGSYDPELFSVLRTEPLPKAAAALAAAGNVAGLAVLLQRHKSTLAPRLLQLLSALPESLDPRMYAALIPRASANAAAAAAAGPAAAAAPRVTRPVGVGNLHVKGLRKVDWVENEETFQFLAAAAAGTGVLGFGDSAQAAAESASAAAGTGLAHMPSIDASPGLPIPVPGDDSSSGSRSGSVGLSSASSLDFSSWALCAEETAVMMHATEELERHCSVNGANKRTLPTDAEIASWLAARALQLDAATGQLPEALHLLELAVDKGYGQFQVEVRGSTASPGTESSTYMPVGQLLVQGRVLLQLVRSWWPDKQPSQQQDATHRHSAHADADTETTSAAAAAAAGADAGAAQNAGQPAGFVAGVAAAAEAALGALQPLWSVTLQQWVSVGLLAQLLAVLNGSSRDLLQQDVKERVSPLLQCYPHDQRIAALHHLLVYWIAAPATAASSSSQQRGSSGSGSGTGGSSSSKGTMLAAALLAGETELLQAAAAASTLLVCQHQTGGSQQQQQLLAVVQAAAASSGEGSLGPLLWGGDVAAMVSAVLAAVSACRATNQWARVEQLLNAAGDALAAAAALNGLQVGPGQLGQLGEVGVEQEGQGPERDGRVSGSSSHGSAEESEQADMATRRQQQHQQQEGQVEEHELQQQQQQKAKQKTAARGGGDGWGDDWSSEGEEHEQAWPSQHQQQQRDTAVLAATEPLRTCVLQFALQREAVQQLQAQLDAMRGQVRAARLLTKHGCCVSIEQVAAADGRDAKEWLSQLLGRAERLGTSWPEAQWAQVWHDLLEARQAGLSVQLPAADLAAAFLHVLLLAQQYHLAVQFLPLRTQQQLLTVLTQGGTPNAGTPTAMEGMGAFDLAMDAAAVQQHSAGSFMADHAAAAAARDADRPATAEAALAALTGGGGGMFPGRSRFGVRKALHNAAGAAVSTAVGSTAKLMGVSAHLVGSTAHLVGSTAQAVQYGTGGVMGATAGLVSGTASLVSSAATFAAEAAAKAGSKAGTVFKGSSGDNVDLRGATGLLTVDEAEAVVVQVSKELLGSAASLSDPAVAAAEAVLQLLPPECKAAAAQRDSVAVLQRLPEFGVSLLPAQLTSLPDKHQLLQRILFGRHTYAAAAAAAASGSSGGWSGSSVAPWRRLGDVLELAALLGLGSEDEQNEVRLMAAEAALSAGEVGIATHLCLQLAAVRYGPAWHLAAELACPQRFAAQRQQRAAKVKQLMQQEQHVQQQLRESLSNDETPKQQQQQQQLQDQETVGDSSSTAVAAAAEEAAAAADAAEVGQPGDLHVHAGDGDASSVSIPSPATPGAPSAAAAAAAAAECEQAHEGAVAAEASAASIAAADAEDTPAAIDVDAKQQQEEPQQQQTSDAGLQPPGTPVAAASSAREAADASATVVETAAVTADTDSRQSKGGVSALTAAQLQLPARDRKKLLAFAACFCPSGELPALTDDLVFAHQELSEQQASRQKQQQQGAGEDAQQHEQQQIQDLNLLLPLQQLSSHAFQQQRQQLLRMALAATATAQNPKGWVDPHKGLFSFGDPQALLAVLLSCSSASEAQQLLDDVLSNQLSAGANGSSASAAGSSYCSLQRLLVVGAAAQLLLVMQNLSEGVLVEVVAGAPGSKASCNRLKLPHHQELLLQLLHVPMGQLQLAAKRLLQQQEQQQLGLLPADAGDAVAAAGALMSRLQQVADGRQLLQWLPGIETGRFFAGDKQYQEQVLIELASKAGQMAVQLPNQQQQEQQDQQQQAAAAQALLSQAQQLAASYGADPFQLQLWFVHSLVLYAPDINQPDVQDLLAAHAQQLLRNPAAAVAHLYNNTYPLLPAAAAGQCACVLGLIHSALQAFCTQQQQQQGGSETAGSGDGGGGSSGGGSGGQAVPAAVTVALPQLVKLQELLVKSSKALSGLAAKALIGGHVALMVGPAVAAATAMAADSTAATPAAAAAAAAGVRAGEEGSVADAQQQEDSAKQLEAATAAAAAAVASVDLQMVLLEASSAVSAFVSTPGQAGVVAKFIRHMNTLAEMHARASVGDKPKQQALQKLAQGVSPGLPHLLLFMRTMTSSTVPEQQQQYWADPDDQSEGLNRVGSGESFQSAISVSSSQASGQHAAHPGHNPAAAMAIEWATARARYASSGGRQQLLNCSALQLSAVASWLVLSQQQPVPSDAVGQLQPLAMGPGLQLQLLTDVITLVSNPEAQLPGMLTGAKRVSSGGSSRGSSSQQSSVTAEQAAATAVAAAAALSAATGVPVGGLTQLMRDDPAAIAAWQPPSLPASLVPKRRELVVPLLQAASRIVAKHVILSAVAAAAPAGAAAGAAAEAAIENVASAVSQAVVLNPQNEGQQAVAPASCMLELLQGLISAGSFPAVAALQLAHQLALLQLALGEAVGQQPAAAADGADSSGDASNSTAVLAGQQAEQAVLTVLQRLTQAALNSLQQQLTADEGDGSIGSPAGASVLPKRQPSALQTLQLLIRCLEQDAAPASSPKAAAAAADEADDADSAAATDSSGSWVLSSIQQLRGQLWDALQQHQAQLPAEAYSSALVAELLELQETISSGAAWPGWATGAGSGTALAGAAAAGAVDAGGRPKSSGAGLLLARTMTALSKQFPGLKASADDVSSIEAAVGLFSSLVASSSPLSPGQCTALTHLLTDVWRQGAALPQPQATTAGAEAAAGDGDADDASKPAFTEGEQPQQQEQKQDQERLAASVGLPVGSFQLSQLHSCWYQLLLAMLQAGYVQDLLALLDNVAAAATAAVAAASGDAGAKQQQQQQQQGKAILLPLQESEAQQLVAAAKGPLGPAGQAVLGLLLPYRSCQQRVVDQLLQGNLLVGSREPWAGQLLLLLLLRGRLSDLAAAAAAAGGTSGSGVQVVGSVARGGDGSEAAGSVVQQQLYHLYSLLLQPVLAAPVESSGLAWAYLTCLFPHAVSQLCQMSDYAAAAALVAAKMRTCSRLCSFSGAVLVLQRYLEITMQHPWQPPSQQAGTASPLWLPCCEALLASAGADVATTAHTRLVSATRSSAGDA